MIFTQPHECWKIWVSFLNICWLFYFQHRKKKEVGQGVLSPSSYNPVILHFHIKSFPSLLAYKLHGFYHRPLSFEHIFICIHDTVHLIHTDPFCSHTSMYHSQSNYLGNMDLYYFLHCGIPSLTIKCLKLWTIHH